MLNKLQNHVEQEEIRWRQQFETQETRIKMLTDGLAVVKNTNEKVHNGKSAVIIYCF